MKNTLIILISFTFLGLGNRIIAQKVTVVDSCLEWQTVSANNDNQKVTLELSNIGDGQKFLKWSNPVNKNTKFEIHKTKGPINPQGKIEICSIGQSLYFFIAESSYSLLKLFNDGKLKPGNYAIRLVLGPYPGSQSSQTIDYSNWLMIQNK
jgi:hypothetical protein